MRLIYTAGTARGGTNYRTLMFNNHSRIRMSLDPFIPLFRFYRDSLLKAAGVEHLLDRIPARNVLDDYYFSDDKLKIMKTIQEQDPDIAFDMSQWPKLKDDLAGRMKLASVNLIPHLDLLPAATFREVFNNAMRLIAKTSEKDLLWVGFNDNWTMEFFPLIAHLMPDAKFMLHLRDPRAVVASSEFAEPDPSKHPPVMTFARHLRKYYSFANYLKNHEKLSGKLLVTYYEPFIHDPEAEIKRVVEFLGVEYEDVMLDTEKFVKADGSPWPSNWNDYKISSNSWCKESPPEMIELTEFICDPEMRLHQYQPEIYNQKTGVSDSALDYAARNFRECKGWRTDFPEIEKTLGSELYRKKLLTAINKPSNYEIERCFLFVDTYNQLRCLD